MLKKDLTIPGSLVKLKPVLKTGLPAAFGGSEVIDAITITPDVGSIMLTGGWDVSSGAILEIIKKPRRCHGINSCRVRLVSDPKIEGEVYWCELRVSASHI